MNFRKAKLISKFEVVVLFVIFSYFVLHMLGTSNEIFVSIISTVLLLWAITYTFLKLLLSSISSLRSLIKLRTMRENRIIDTMTGVEFEHFIVRVLRSRGYVNVKLTEHYDLGVDIIAEKDGVTWGIQVKRYSNSVGVNAVRQVVTALRGYRCDRSMVITNSPEGYTRPAKELAGTNNCILIDRKILKGWVKDYDMGQDRKMSLN